MADDQPISADDVARKQFASAFRGFDQYEVRAFLARVATELASVQERERSLRERLAAADERPPPHELIEEELEAALGAETMRVLHAAREAAAEIRAKAEESVARLLRESNDEAARLRADAEGVLARRSEEAEAAAAAILTSAEERAAGLLADAETTSASAIEEAQTRGREMVAEAQAVRERILKDLARRRKAAGTQLEQLLAARERLIAAYEVVRANVEDVTHELAVVESEARLAADVAAFKPPPDDESAPGEEPSVTDAPSPNPTPTSEPPAAAEPEPEAEAEPEPEAEPEAEAELADAPRAAVTPPPSPEPEPEAIEADSPSAAPAPSEERRSSSLRLLRRRSEPEPPAPVEDDVEGVRIIRPDDAPESPARPPSRPTLVPDEPDDVEAPPAAAEAHEPESDTPSDEEETDHGVDDLFARLRADRAAALEQAEAVLAEPESEPATPTAADARIDEHEATAEVPIVADELEDDSDEAAESVSVFERRDAEIEPAERALTRALKRALADEQNEVLDALRRMRGKPSLETLLPSVDEHIARYARVSSEHLAHGVNAGAEAVGGEAPKVDELVERLGTEIALDLRTRLERTLDSAGDDDEALVEAISAMYREWKTARSEPLARHHVVAGYALGAFSAADDGAMRWLVDAAEGGCPDCDDNALAGDTPKGTAYPTGQVHPPAHAGCRCVVLPA